MIRGVMQFFMWATIKKNFRRPVRKGFRPATKLSEVTSLFDKGLALHQGDRLVDAEKIYRQVLAMEADHFDSLHLLGVIFHQRGDQAEAVWAIVIFFGSPLHQRPSFSKQYARFSLFPSLHEETP